MHCSWCSGKAGKSPMERSCELAANWPPLRCQNWQCTSCEGVFFGSREGRQESSLLDGCTPKTYREYIPHVCINSTTNQFDIRI